MMTIQEMSHFCNLAGCKLTETEDTLHLEFQHIAIDISKDFNTGKSQLALFMASGWLPTFRQYIKQTNGKEETL